jgi:hypothetical protein
MSSYGSDQHKLTGDKVRRLGRNDPCWCGSGKKFKNCHLGRQTAQAVPLKALEHAVQCAWDHKQCLHPLAAPQLCDKIVSAHTVQRSALLARITDSTNHVETFYRAAWHDDNDLKPRKLGWRKASTFTGFCASHDSLTFAPLEKADFSGSDEQCFLIGYRALCHEIYQKKGLLRAVPLVRDLVDRGQPVEIQQQLQSAYIAIDAGARKGLAALENLKGMMDRQLLICHHSGWSRLIVTFRGEICVASTGGVSPNRDLGGRELQNLQDRDPNRQQTLLLGIVATAEGGAVVLTWPTVQAAPRQFVESLLRVGTDKLGSVLVQYIFAYVENTYFSKRWWASLSPEECRHLASLARLRNACYANFSYSSNRIVPWEVSRTVIQDAV